ncbi:ectoine synthase [Suttonella sp. R2A3]|uniref:ectoine synthase n=1 Tax=Suttonella sp. R2A3 TaxID=2908648 RepID=UPI001F283D23|nr:ectoine synthase [Suttonella sp. R2A3]UJF24502.1 ectoine synthase [Suttonella sp. R2A3]
MIVRTLKECEGTSREVHSGTKTWDSVRMLLKEDGMGYSFHITTVYAGVEMYVHYKHHLQAVYCMSGNGELESVANGEVHPIEAGTLYIMDQYDKHRLRGGTEDMKLACIFNPPIIGQEVHRRDGSFPPTK